MVDRKQMHAILLGLCGLTFGTSCASRPAPFARDGDKARSDRPAPFNPAKTYPEWAYDAPSYTRPVDEPKAEPKSRVKDPEHFFTSKPVIMVHQPEGYRPEEIPRVAVWYTRDNGYHWKKAGYFGRSATYYPLEVKKEGDYGIRFVGPGQESAMETPPNPVCVHHVDMTPPKVKLSLDPQQAWYTLGQRVTVNWTATDPHLEAMPARVSVIPDWESDQSRPIEIAREQADVGSIEYTVPANLMGDGFRIRVDAIDRAGNIGLAYSQTLQVEPDRMRDSATPPVRTIQHVEAVPVAVESQVSANSVQVTGAVSPPSPAPTGGDMLPLEEIPVSAPTTPVKESTPAPPVETPEISPAPQMDERAQATPPTPVSGSTASSVSSTSSTETLPLLPLTESPVVRSSVHGDSKPQPTPAAVPVHDDQTIVRDTPSNAVAPVEAVQDEPEIEDEASLIRPVSVTQEQTENQPQASHQQDVECDSDHAADVGNDTPETSDSPSASEDMDDEEASAATSFDVQQILSLHRDEASSARQPSLLGSKLVSGLRAAEAAVERLLANTKSSTAVTAAELVRGADVMVGGGLAAPMPATVLSMSRAPSSATPHAWRTLATRASRRSGEVWMLPRPMLRFELPRFFARDSNGAARSRGMSAENFQLRGSRIQAVAVSSDPD